MGTICGLSLIYNLYSYSAIAQAQPIQRDVNGYQRYVPILGATNTELHTITAPKEFLRAIADKMGATFMTNRYKNFNIY